VTARKPANQIEMFEGAGAEGKRAITFKPIQRPLWTQNKARLISRYLYYFVLVTKHGTYIDGFGGPQSPDNEDMWAAKLVIESRPRWLRTLVLGDIEASQVARIRSMVEGQLPRDTKKEPKREIHVLQGDFNSKVADALSYVNAKQAAFCLLDQRTFECDWATVEKVAKYKKTGTKIEIFYFLPVGWFARAVSGLRNPETHLKKWWGRDDWNKLASQRTRTLADLTVQRFRQELGYEHAHPWPIYEKPSGGRVLYYMIHASDHDQAPGLMRRAYSKALDEPEPPEQLDFLAAGSNKSSC
jgi:three-Cys-motif partner protein